MRHFEDLVTGGEWDEAEKYLSGFTKVDDNRYSMKIFFELQKQKYLEVFDRRDRAKAVEILVNDLRMFAAFNEELFKIDAHAGGVNDLAFAYPNKQLYVITCGDDKLIKVWDVPSGRKLYTLEGYEVPVYSLCSHHKENIRVLVN